MSDLFTVFYWIGIFFVSALIVPPIVVFVRWSLHWWWDEMISPLLPKKKKLGD